MLQLFVCLLGVWGASTAMVISRPYVAAGANLSKIASYTAFIDTSNDFVFVTDRSKGHLRSSEVTNSFLSITCDQQRYRYRIDVIAFISSGRID